MSRTARFRGGEDDDDSSSNSDHSDHAVEENLRRRRQAEQKSSRPSVPEPEPVKHQSPREDYSSLLPPTTELFTSSPIAAGLPILELIQKLEEEKILTRDDRYELKDILYAENNARRAEVIKALQEVELSGGSRFAVRRLKAAIYQNGAGEVSSRNQRETQKQHIPLDLNISRFVDSQPNGKGVDVLGTQSARTHKDKPKKNTPNSILENTRDESESEDSSRKILLASASEKVKSPALLVTPQEKEKTKRKEKEKEKLEAELERQEEEEEAEQIWNVQSTVSKVVGVASHYAGGNVASLSKAKSVLSEGSIASSGMANRLPTSRSYATSSQASAAPSVAMSSSSSTSSTAGRHFNVLQKIAVRIEEIFEKYSPEMLLKQRKLAVLVGGGSYNPLTRMHLRNFFLAKQYLEKHFNYIVLGSLLSPAHPNTVRERYRTNPNEILPAPHRLVIAQLLVNTSQWLTIDPWEITRRRPMDYLALIEHVKFILQDCFPGLDIQIFYLCKSNSVPTLSPQALKALNCQVITVCRIAEAELLQKSLESVHNSKQWLQRNFVHIVEDSAILDASLDMVTSRKVREKIKNNENIETLVGAKIQEYVIAHKLGAKMKGQEEWSAQERSLPKIASRPPEPTLHGHGFPRNGSSLSTSSVQSLQSQQSPISLSSQYVPSWNPQSSSQSNQK